MNFKVLLFLCFGFFGFNAAASAEECSLPLTDQQIKDIVDQERLKRSDLPRSFDKQGWRVTKKGCYYLYMESYEPEIPDVFHVFRINRNGLIVDVIDGQAKILPP
ncbi:hypothetical protein [Methylomonas sp. UP202]|uniref:hypothetical protein n=1 Tax=Methylomonas sp. UP202 TaxID=3040943 RepID=UPI00247AF90F|nr:hypothetical protein [Methylomonas sp. UP202]WGS86472.1 hypothetical protein QC632_01615 [Methylomonas sp. UP202]